MRRFAKHAVEALLNRTGIQRIALRSVRRRTLVLAYHNVIPAGESPCGDRSLHLAQNAFAAQLDCLCATHDVIPLAAIYTAPIGLRPRAVVTFDDAYRGAVTVGVAEVVKRRLPATIFVAPGILGAATWWDRLADPAIGDVLPTLRNAVLSRHQGLAHGAIAEFGAGSFLPPWAEIAADHEVRTAAAQPGITIGAHTWNHPNLTTLGAEDLAGELSRPFDWLRSVGDQGLPWLAYPYGLTSPTVAAAAKRAGYLGAFRVDGGWIRSTPPPPGQQFDLPRMNVPSGLSLNGFRLKVSGF